MKKKWILAVALGVAALIATSASAPCQYGPPLQGWQQSHRFSDVEAIDLYHRGELVGSLTIKGYWVPAGANWSSDVYGYFTAEAHAQARQKGVKNFGNDWQGSAPNESRPAGAGDKVTINGKPASVDEAKKIIDEGKPGPPCPCPCPPGGFSISWPLIGTVVLVIAAIGVLVYFRNRN